MTPGEKNLCQQNLRGVSRDILIFFGYVATVSSFIIVGNVWQILGRGSLFTPTPLLPIHQQPRKGPT